MKYASTRLSKVAELPKCDEYRGSGTRCGNAWETCVCWLISKSEQSQAKPGAVPKMRDPALLPADVKPASGNIRVTYQDSQPLYSLRAKKPCHPDNLSGAQQETSQVLRSIQTHILKRGSLCQKSSLVEQQVKYQSYLACPQDPHLDSADAKAPLDRHTGVLFGPCC